MKNSRITRAGLALLSGACVLAAASVGAAPLTTNLYAKLVWINPLTGSADSVQGSPALGRIPMWGFAATPGGVATVPGPKIDVTESQVADGLIITVYNTDAIPEPVSLVIPGLEGGAPQVGTPFRFGPGDANYPNRVRSLVPDVPNGSARQYRWNGPLKPGTYAYHSGSHMAVQVQMGLYGMVTVRLNNNQVYPGLYVPLNREVPVIFSEVDPVLHWAVQTNGYGPGQAISSTIHSDPSLFLINGRAYSSSTPAPSLTGSGARNQQTLFRMINFCWDSRIPTLVGPVPVGNISSGGHGGHYLTAIAEDGKPYPYPRTAYAPNLAALKTMDLLFTPPNPGGPPLPLTYRLYDHRLGLSNPSSPEIGGMLATWIVAPF